MSARDDFGSSAGRGPGAGGLGNGGIGGGMGAGSRGGGAGYNGGAGSRTGLTTGTTWHGNTAFGAPGGRATGYATRDAGSLGRAGMGPTMGQYGGFKDMAGNSMFAGSPIQGQSFSGMGAGQAYGKAKQAHDAWKDSQIEQGPLNLPTTNRPAPNRPAYDAEMALPEYPPVPTNPPSFVNNPFIYKPATLADYVQRMVNQGLNATPAAPPAAWTPASPSNPPVTSVPGYTNVERGFLGRNWTNNQANWPRQSVPGTRSTNSTDESGSPSLDPKGSYPPGYASGGLVRSAMLTAKGVSNGMKGALVVNQKGNVVSGKLKSGPIVQVGTGGNVMKRGTVKITWGS